MPALGPLACEQPQARSTCCGRARSSPTHPLPLLARPGYDLPLFSSPPGRPPLCPLALGRLRRELQELHTCTLGRLWDARRELVDNRWRGLEPGPQHFAEVQRRELSMHRDLSAAAVVSTGPAHVGGGCCGATAAGRTVGRRQAGRQGLPAPLVCSPIRQCKRQMHRRPSHSNFHRPCPLPSPMPLRSPWEQLGYLASWSAYATHRRQHPDAADPLEPFRAALLEATGLDEQGADSPEPVLRLEWPIFMLLAKGPVPLPAPA